MRKTVARTLSSRSNLALTLCLCLWLGACATAERPNEELVLAREAIAAATEVESSRYSPAYFHKAEETYRKAMVLYKEQRYKDAITQFKLSRTYSEKAENTARLQRQKAGEEGL